MAVGCHGNCISCFVAPQAADSRKFRTKLQSEFFILFLFRGSLSLIKNVFRSWTMNWLILLSSAYYILYHATSHCSCAGKLVLAMNFATLPLNPNPHFIWEAYLLTPYTLFIPIRMCLFLFSMRKSSMYLRICVIFRDNYFILEWTANCTWNQMCVQAVGGAQLCSRLIAGWFLFICI